MAEVESVSGQEGNWDVKVKLNPRYVNEKCTGCGKCAEVCEMEIDNAFNYNMDKIKAAYLPHDMAFPQRYVLDPALVKSPEAQKVKEACPYDAIELDMRAKSFDLNVGAIVWATDGAYDPKSRTPSLLNIPTLTNVRFERLAAFGGPTQAKLSGPPTAKSPETVALSSGRFARRKPHALLHLDLCMASRSRPPTCSIIPRC